MSGEEYPEGLNPFGDEDAPQAESRLSLKPPRPRPPPPPRLSSPSKQTQDDVNLVSREVLSDGSLIVTRKVVSRQSDDDDDDAPGNPFGSESDEETEPEIVRCEAPLESDQQGIDPSSPSIEQEKTKCDPLPSSVHSDPLNESPSSGRRPTPSPPPPTPREYDSSLNPFGDEEEDDGPSDSSSYVTADTVRRSLPSAPVPQRRSLPNASKKRPPPPPPPRPPPPKTPVSEEGADDSPPSLQKVPRSPHSKTGDSPRAKPPRPPPPKLEEHQSPQSARHRPTPLPQPRTRSLISAGLSTSSGALPSAISEREDGVTKPVRRLSGSRSGGVGAGVAELLRGGFRSSTSSLPSGSTLPLRKKHVAPCAPVPPKRSVDEKEKLAIEQDLKDLEVHIEQLERQRNKLERVLGISSSQSKQEPNVEKRRSVNASTEGKAKADDGQVENHDAKEMEGETKNGDKGTEKKCEDADEEANGKKVEADQVKGEADQVKGEADQVKGEADQVKGEADQVKGEADQVKGEADQAKDEADQAKDEADDEKTEADDGKKEVDSDKNLEADDRKEDASHTEKEADDTKKEASNIKMESQTTKSSSNEVQSPKNLEPTERVSHEHKNGGVPKAGNGRSVVEDREEEPVWVRRPDFVPPAEKPLDPEEMHHKRELLKDVVEEIEDLRWKQEALRLTHRGILLEEEQAELDHTIRFLKAKPNPLITPQEKLQLEEAMKKIFQVIEDRNQIVEELDRKRMERGQHRAMDSDSDSGMSLRSPGGESGESGKKVKKKRRRLKLKSKTLQKLRKKL